MDDQDPSQSDRVKIPPLKTKIKLTHRLRNYFFTGIVVTAPAAITLYVAWLLISSIDERVQNLFPREFNPDQFFPFGIPGLGIVILVVSLTLIGALTAGLFGRMLVRTSEYFLNKMPFIGGMYKALKQIFHTVFSERSNAFRQVVLFEYPRKGIWSMGFVTGETEGEVDHKIKKKTLNIFYPTTPNPTSGMLLFLPKEDVILLDMSVEEGLKMIISGGIVVPEEHKK